FNLTGIGEPERIAAASITANLIPELGVTPLIGRSFLPEEETNGHNHVVLLGYKLWQRLFGGDRSVINKTVQLNGVDYTIVGIMPAVFQFAAMRELWVPLVLDPATEPWRADRANRNLSVFGRLKAGVTIDQAMAAMSQVSEDLGQQHPKSNSGWGVRMRTFYDWIVPQEVRQSLLVLLGAVAFVLLIGCGNVANLGRGRGWKRRGATAIRAALGASRGRLIRQLLVESLLMSAFACLAGLLLTVWE